MGKMRGRVGIWCNFFLLSGFDGEMEKRREEAKSENLGS